MRPFDSVGNKGIMETIDPIRTTHAGMGKIVQDLKKVEVTEGVLHQTLDVSSFEKSIPYEDSM